MKSIDLKSHIDKVVINSGLGRLSQAAGFNDKILPEIETDFMALTGQKPVRRPAKKSIAGFKMREGNIVGMMVTLRGVRAYSFLQKLIHTVLPRVRDFRGVAETAVDANGNLTIGIKEHIVFPEISAEVSKVNFGLEATIVPKVSGRVKALELYKAIGIPFKK